MNERTQYVRKYKECHLIFTNMQAARLLFWPVPLMLGSLSAVANVNKFNFNRKILYTIYPHTHQQRSVVE